MPARRAGNHDCPIRDVLDRIGDAWSLLVLIELGKGPCRFNALSRVINGISPRMLIVTLRHLERDGFVEQLPAGSAEAGAYALSALGQSLLGTLGGLIHWAETSQSAVREARHAYDQRQDAA